MFSPTFVRIPILMMTLVPTLLHAAATTRPSKSTWDAAFLHYDRPASLAVEETTPTADQVNWNTRPRPMPETKAPVPTKATASPRTAGGMDIVRLRFRNTAGNDVPALLATPAGKAGPFPLVIAVHGLTSNKAQVLAQVGPQLAKRGFAMLAPDMPLHGERAGEPRQLFDRSDLQAFLARMHESITDIRQCIDLAEARPGLDVKSGVTLVGYSMGAMLDSVAGPADARVSAMVLMVGGAPEFHPALALVPQFATLQPQLAIPNFAPRPILMLNGKSDLTVRRDMGERLFAAAADPKRIIWYDAGHLLPARAYEDAAEWVATQWERMRR